MVQLAGQFHREPELLALALIQSSDDADFVDLDAIGADSGSASGFEGAVARRLVVHRERDPRLRRQKIDDSLARRQSISCEACGFDFEERYGELGAGYTHVHHIVPLHISGPVVTTLEDLVLVCANCHVMVHRRIPWKSPEDLKGIISQNS
ncbi:MAG: HNH endonuclease [Gordonia sp. (in: high G+C Gram-positive bacteria)]